MKSKRPHAASASKAGSHKDRNHLFRWHFPSCQRDSAGSVHVQSINKRRSFSTRPRGGARQLNCKGCVVTGAINLNDRIYHRSNYRITGDNTAHSVVSRRRVVGCHYSSAVSFLSRSPREVCELSIDRLIKVRSIAAVMMVKERLEVVIGWFRCWSTNGNPWWQCCESFLLYKSLC